ncbi:MAG: acetyltransferase [Candidatus Margulisiibacteriota bacterium]
MKEKIILVGGGDHARVVADTAEMSGEYHLAGYVDIEDRGLIFGKIPFLGKDVDFSDLIKKGICKAICTVGSTGEMSVRLSVIEKMKSAGLELVNIIHPTAIIAQNSTLGKGIFVGAGAIINPSAQIKDNVIINTGAIIEHDCLVSQNAIVSPGVVLGGRVQIGANAFVGLGTHIIQGIKIGENALIGAGSVVIKDVAENFRVAGVPARRITNDR